MNSSEIFTLALGLAEPWYVSKVELIEGEQSKKELHLWLSFTRGYRFTFGTKEYTTYDTIDKTWLFEAYSMRSYRTRNAS